MVEGWWVTVAAAGACCQTRLAGSATRRVAAVRFCRGPTRPDGGAVDPRGGPRFIGAVTAPPPPNSSRLGPQVPGAPGEAGVATARPPVRPSTVNATVAT